MTKSKSDANFLNARSSPDSGGEFFCEQISDSEIKPPVFIVGPTASGKSELAYLAAKRFDGIIISADSMQIYRGLDIGTAKESLERRSEIRHEMIDIIPAEAEFSVAEYAERAKNHIKKAQDSGKLPIICGGTGLYIESLIYPMSFAFTAKNKELRERLNRELDENGAEFMHEKLKALDLDSAQRLHVNDVKRVIRALEIVLSTGKPVAENADIRQMNGEKSEFMPVYKNLIMIGLNTDRKVLYDKINARVDEMINGGLINEVFSVGNFGCQSMKAIGYKEFAECDYLKDDKTGEFIIQSDKLKEITEKIKQNTRNYAKRQLTWFRKYGKSVRWFECGDYENALSYIESRLFEAKYSDNRVKVE